MHIVRPNNVPHPVPANEKWRLEITFGNAPPIRRRLVSATNAPADHFFARNRQWWQAYKAHNKPFPDNRNIVVKISVRIGGVR